MLHKPRPTDSPVRRGLKRAGGGGANGVGGDPIQRAHRTEIESRVSMEAASFLQRAAAAAAKAALEVPVFRPTMEEFRDFAAYVTQLEARGAHEIGMARIVPPAEWTPRRDNYSNVDMMIHDPIVQHVSGRNGVYTQLNIVHRGMNLLKFRELALSPERQAPKHVDVDDLERRYWKNVTFVTPLYGADMPGSLFDDDQTVWNLHRLPSLLDVRASAAPVAAWHVADVHGAPPDPQAGEH